MSDLTIDTKHDGATEHIHIGGELDIATIGELTQAATSALENPGCTWLAISLAGLVFIDSSGLGALVALRANAEQHNTSLVLTDIPGPVRRIMELGGLGNLLSNEPRESTATSTETRNTFS